MPKALVFGANGFVAGHLAREFSTHGWEVIGADLAPVPIHSNISSYFACDIADAGCVAGTVEAVKPDAIVNLAAISSVGFSWTEPARTMRVNVEGTLNVLEAARALPTPPRILLVGSSEEYVSSSEPLAEDAALDATNPYGISKATQERFAELYAERYGLGVYRVRAFNHTGLGQNVRFVLPSWCKQAAEIACGMREPVMRVGNLEVARDFSDVRDVVRAYRLLIESDYAGAVFNIGSGRAVPLRELLEVIAGFTAQDVHIDAAPELLRPSDNPFICCDNSRACNLLGWQPRHRIEDTLREMFDEFVKGCQNKGRGGHR